MNSDDLLDLTKNLRSWSADLEILRQNRLLNHREFWDFARERRILGSPEWADILVDFERRGWLRSDGTDYQDKPLFHPFRIYALGTAVQASRLRLGPPMTLDPNLCKDMESRILAALPSVDEIDSMTRLGNRIVDLAILLEPLYWPRIVGSYTRHGGIAEAAFQSLMERYRERALTLVTGLVPTLWQEVHERLRDEAAQIDGNDKLYLLLRLADAEERLKLTGEVGHALWLRHIAEVIRRGFEEVHGVQWLEEDIAFGWWPEGSRTNWYGSERPLDTEMRSVPYLAWRFGLLTGSVIRWYVEGKTEYYAILRVIPKPELLRIELVNLHGEFGDKGNTALKLAEWLQEDLRLRRFSMISFDRDVSENVKVIQNQVKAERVVGFISANQPDFEFHNFTLEELVEVAARLDEAHGVSGATVRAADWTGITKGKTFEQYYLSVSERHPPSLKGKEWGEALAAYAIEQPTCAGTGAERPFWGEIRAASTGRKAHYDLQKKRMAFDLETFQLREREQAGDEPTNPV